MNPVYNLSMHALRGAIALGAIRSKKLALMKQGQKETLRTVGKRLKPTEHPVWIHAASLGEFEQGRPLIERIKSEHPEIPILLTFFSPSGYEVRKNYPKVDAVAYLPADTPGAVKSFLDMVQPRAAIFVKYEFWGNYLQSLQQRGVPTYIISAIFRSTQPFFKPWGKMWRNMLSRFNHLYLQDKTSRKLLEGIGITQTTVAGDTRFDRVTDIMKTSFAMPEIEQFTAGAPLTAIIGSSWEADEDVYLDWFNRHPEIKLIIAPHEFDVHRVKLLLNRIVGKAVPLSRYTEGDSDARALIVDCFGKLASIYRYCDVAYIGGGFGTGIHNINEAAVYDMPVIFGPRYDKFKEAKDLIRLGGAFTISSKDEFESAMDKLLDNTTRANAGKRAGDYVRSQIGATDVIYKDLETVIANKASKC